MNFIDTNILVYAAEPGDRNRSIAAQVIDAGGIVSVQVLNELANVLLVKERRGRITPELSRKPIQLVEKMLPSTDKIIDTGAILALGRQHGLSAYDAAYLELAKRIGAPLATLDRKLAQAAEAEGVPVNPTA